MHTPTRNISIVRPIVSLTVVLLMLVSPLAATLPVGGVHTDAVDGVQLPIEWALDGGQSGTFNVTLPVGEVTEATLELEGTGVEVTDAFGHTADHWLDGDNVVFEGVDLSNGALEAATEHLNVWEGPGDLGSNEISTGVHVGETVTLALTSPRFKGANGGIWKHYIPVEISLGTGRWERQTLTFVHLDIPAGHCKDTMELRIADPDMMEVPVQVIDRKIDVDTGTVVYVELLFPTDMPPEGSRTYRVYYGNPNAIDPEYPPMLLGAELWNYTGLLDANFRDNWKSLRWTGGNGAGWGWTRFTPLGGNSKSLDQTVTINPARTFSQVWTSAHLKNDDFQLATWVGNFNHEGPWRSTAMWALDFRVQANDCYRLMYTESLTNATTPKLTLYRVTDDRHFADINTTSSSWRVLDDLAISPIGEEIVPIRIRCRGPDIDIWVGGGNQPALRARDTGLTTGEIGTFVGGRGVMFAGNDTTVSCSVGPMLVLQPNLNLTDKSHSFYPLEERQQHALSGNWISDKYELPGARDAIFSLDIRVPFDTKYTARLVNAAGDVVLIDQVTDGMQVPEDLLDGGFKLEVQLDTANDAVTPELRGWGIGYRAMVNPASDRAPFEKVDVSVSGGAISLFPSRDVWIKNDLPLIKGGNIDEDAAGVSIGSVVPYGDSWRVYYTGRSSTGAQTICVAISPDGETFTEFQPVLRGNTQNMAWDSTVRDPVVLFLGDVWLMYYIGELYTGQVGLALSGNGIDWTRLDRPVFGPSNSGFDSWSIVDCHVVLTDTLFMMYYTGMGGNMSATAIGYAYSGDGGTWTRSPNNPVLKPGTNSADWDSGYVRSPWLVPTRDKYVLYYMGGQGTDATSGLSSIGYAVSSNGLAFNKAAANPVVEPRVGGLADDYRGIRRAVVIEGPDEPHAIIYTGQGMDWINRVFQARSGYVGDGHYITKPFHLDRRPDSWGGLEADMDVPQATKVTISIRTSPDGDTWTGWQDISGAAEVEDVPTEAFFQLRLDLSSEFGEDTPLVHRLILDYLSCVRFSSLTVFPVPIVPEPIVAIHHELLGVGAGDVDVDVYFSEMGWSDLVIYGGHGRYGSGPDFGYRYNFTSPPARAHSLTDCTFGLVFISLPSELTIDVGGDGTVDHTHELPEFQGLHEINVSGPTRSWMDSNGPPEDELTITFSITTATAGIVTLHGVSFTVDTTPRVVAHSPEALEVYLEEGDSREFGLTVDELDSDDLEYTWYIDYAAVAHTPTFIYTAEEDGDTEDPAPVAVKVVVSDGTHNAPMVQWTVYVEDTTVVPNVEPFVDSYTPDAATVTMDENTTQGFWAYITDPDAGPNALTYTWYVNGTQAASGASLDAYEFQADLDDAGTYTIRVEATDGLASVDHSWELVVKNVKEPGPNGNGNNGDTEDEPGVNWLPILFILIIIGVIAAGGVLYMRSKSVPTGGEAAPTEGAGPVTADVPLEPELAAEAAEATQVAEATQATQATQATEATQAAPPVKDPSFTETATLGKDVAGGPGLPEAAAATAPIGVLPLADLDKDRTFVVEEVYVVYNDGRLMCHQARAERTSVDTDLFGGMFTAIQQFIHDSMGGEAGSGTQVGRLDYGENRILVERGKYIFLAAIIFGEEVGSLREAIRDVVNRIEGSYAGVIERWSGDQTLVAGVGAFVAPLIGLTQDLNREAIMAKTRTVGVKMLSEVEFFQGFVRLKVAVRNDTRTVITNVATDIVYDGNVLRVDRIQPDYPMSGTKVTLGTISPREKKTVAYYLDPLICQESDIDGTTSFKDAEGSFGTVTMKRRRADIVCPIFFTEENANTAMLKRLIHEELKESDSKLFTIPKMLDVPEAFALGKEVVRGHDVRFVREFLEQVEGQPFRAEAWYYGVTKVKKDKMVIRTSVWEDRRTIEFFVAAGRMESITGLLAELGQNLNKALKDKYLGRVSATLVVDPGQQEEVKGLGLLIDKYSEGEMDAGEVDQHL